MCVKRDPKFLDRLSRNNNHNDREFENGIYSLEEKNSGIEKDFQAPYLYKLLRQRNDQLTLPLMNRRRRV